MTEFSVSAVLSWLGRGMEKQEEEPLQRAGFALHLVPLPLFFDCVRQWRKRREKPSQHFALQEKDLAQKSVHHPAQITLLVFKMRYGPTATIILCSLGISWFISAEELPSDALKENQPAEGMTGGQNFTWFLPYSSTTQWREPLRQRQVPEDHSSSCSDRTWTKTPPSAGAKLSLQVCSLFLTCQIFYRNKHLKHYQEVYQQLCRSHTLFDSSNPTLLLSLLPQESIS